MAADEGQEVVLFTGGGQGIGKGIAQRLLREGMKVVIADMTMRGIRRGGSGCRRISPPWSPI